MSFKIKLATGLIFLLAQEALAKEIALTFDDAPFESTAHFDSEARSRELAKKLKDLAVPPVMIFVNPCKQPDRAKLLSQLKLYTDEGHFVGNHTCSHSRFDDVGYNAFVQDAAKGDKELSQVMVGQKYFRFPYLNEGSDTYERDKMRSWLSLNSYRNGFVSVDNDDYLFSFKINQAKSLGKSIDYDKIKELFLDHLVGAVEFYDNLAQTNLGRSPKHVLLLHEMDATVMFIEPLVKELRQRGWKIVSVHEAFADPIYNEAPLNTYANNGLLAQLAFEKTGKKQGYFKFDELKTKLNQILGL